MTAIPDVAENLRDFNASNRAHEDLWARGHQARDMVRHGAAAYQKAQHTAQHAHDFHLAVQAEHPRRRASLLQQLILAALTVALDGVACWFAAQALGGGQVETLLWTGLFLAVLAGGEVALDHYSDRNRKVWRLLAVALAVFVTGLGVLRFQFLAAVSTDGLVAALVGAALFTATTAGFLMIGYRALRAAETPRAWRARRRARQARRAETAASAELAGQVATRDRLVDAYLARIRVSLVKKYTSGELPAVEAAVRAHLTGSDSP